MSTASQDATGVDHDNLRHVVITSTCFAFILSTTAVGFRILSRKINGTGLFIDDYLMLSALVRSTRVIQVRTSTNLLKLWEWGISIAGVVRKSSFYCSWLIKHSPSNFKQCFTTASEHIFCM